MKIFLSLLTVVMLLAAAAVVPKLLRNRDQMYQDRLLGALAAIERSITTTNDNDQRVGLYAPKLRTGAGSDHWLMDGVLASNHADGEPTYAPFSASLRLTCQKLLDTACWQIDHLKVGNDTLANVSQSLGSPTRPVTPRS